MRLKKAVVEVCRQTGEVLLAFAARQERFYSRVMHAAIQQEAVEVCLSFTTLKLCVWCLTANVGVLYDSSFASAGLWFGLIRLLLAACLLLDLLENPPRSRC
jgi:hypothetical protein